MKKKHHLRIENHYFLDKCKHASLGIFVVEVALIKHGEKPALLSMGTVQILIVFSYCILTFCMTENR
jgi:lysine/ornithine N-monooxygenase